MQTIAKQTTLSLSRLTSGTLMVAGTTIGAGMLGMPLLTAKAGFWPAVFISILVWAFMLATGLLLLEVCLRMPQGANFLTLSEMFFQKKGKMAVGLLFAFLYYALLVAFFSAGALLLGTLLAPMTGGVLSDKGCLFAFSLLFGSIVALGHRWIDRVNSLLTIAMFIAYALLLLFGCSAVSVDKLNAMDFSVSFLATPVLFCAFGYHNVIPSLTSYLQKDKRSLRLSIFFGTTIALAIFLLWQWLIIGSISKETLEETLKEGLPVTQALQAVTGHPGVFRLGQFFAFFALTTSLLGVCFSMVDFLGEAFSIARRGIGRVFLTVMTFLPPVVCVLWDPTLFDKALGVAGGIGEACLNGLVPIFMYMGLQKKDLQIQNRKMTFCLSALIAFCLSVMAVELKELFHW